MADLSSPPRPAMGARLPWRETGLLLGVAAAVAAGTFAYVFLVEPRLQEQAALKEGGPFDGKQPMISTPMLWPGVQQPAAVPAAEASLADDAEVLGISVGDRHRAYLVRAFNSPNLQVVNDLFGDVPVTVTFCARSQRARAFTGPKDGKSLDIWFGGWFQGRMLVALNQLFYEQDSGQSTNPSFNGYALPPYPCTQTTWKAWKTAHPTTDIYLGEHRPELLPRRSDNKSGT